MNLFENVTYKIAQNFKLFSTRNMVVFCSILFLGALIYIPRLDVLPYRGEEPRRVVTSYELLQSGQWATPTIQHEVFLSRPPFQNWVIAITGLIRGNFDHLTGRLPSAICALLTAMVICGYCLTLSYRHAFIAALFFLTMPQIIQLGRTAETELMFVFLLSTAVFIWHLGELRSWSRTTQWSASYLLLACATLTKGVNQAPLFFGCIIFSYGYIHHKLKSFFSYGHLVGLTLFILIVGGWQLRFAQQVDSSDSWYVHVQDVLLRFHAVTLKDYLKHLIIFPFELLAMMLPWSLVLPIYSYRRFWLILSDAEKSLAVFCLLSIAVTILFVWLPPDSRTRYFTPLFPSFAILAAIAFCATAKNQLWKNFFTIFKLGTLCIPLFGILNFFIAVFHMSIWKLPPGPIDHATYYMIGCLAIGLLFFISILPYSIEKIIIPNLGLYAIFVALTMSFVYTDFCKAVYNDIKPALFSTLARLPKEANLVSVGPVSYNFLYYYLLYTGKTIPIISTQLWLNGKNKQYRYFCANNETMQYLAGMTEQNNWITMGIFPANRNKSQDANHPKDTRILLNQSKSL